MIHSLTLHGCTPEPLMNYLKAVGVFRLVSEQCDPAARLNWVNGTATLHSILDREALITFFLEQYRPTPILAPWNGGSGFYGGGSAPVTAISEATTSRLSLFRTTISAVQQIVPKSKPKDTDKQSLLAACRAVLPDDVVVWLDTCFVLGEDGPRYFPLLGTGGNDGRLDFTNNFMQRLEEIIAFAAGDSVPEKSYSLLSSSVFADELVSLQDSAVGQFSPGSIGGANAVQGKFEAGSQVNPWDYVLMLEGTLLFAGAVARRMGQATSLKAVFPFSVDSIAVGYGSAIAGEETQEGSRAELWLPLWDNAATYAEIRLLFAEGRAQLGRRQARNALEFALAANLLGVSRGISSFSRYGFLKRNGLAFLAAPLGRIAVQSKPEARLLEDPELRDWLERFRRATSDKERTPQRYQSALRRIDRAIFEFAGSSSLAADQAPTLVRILESLGAAEQTLSRGLRFAKDKGLRPLQRLPLDWIDQADDGSCEFRLAASLAAIRGAGKQAVQPLRAYLEEVDVKGQWASWSPGSCSCVWSQRDLAANLSAVFQRRQLEAFRSDVAAAGVPIESPVPAQLADVLEFLHGRTDDQKIVALLWALIGLNWSAWKPSTVRGPRAKVSDGVPMEFGLPRLLVHPVHLCQEAESWQWNPDVPATTPDSAVFHELSSGRKNAVSDAVTSAARRLKSSGHLIIGYRNRLASGKALQIQSRFSAERLLAAMLFPLSKSDLTRIANSVLFHSKTTSAQSVSQE
jgi:CRISPR-associated protein Csx17